MPIFSKASSASLLKAIPKAASRPLLAALCAGLSLAAQAQWTAGTAGAGGSAASTGTNATLGTAGASVPAATPAPAGPSRSLVAPKEAAGTATDAPRALRADAAERAAPGPLSAPLAPNQFQRFVQETTGRSLPLHGYNLFATGGFPALSNVPVPANYVLGPGDEIELKIWGAIDANLRLAVDRNGQVSIPRVGTVTVAGTQASQLEPLLKAQIGRIYNNFELSATLGQLRSIQVFVVGQARRPGAYTVSSLSTLVSALFESGGPAPTGSMRKIQLMRAGRVAATIDLYQFIHRGDTSADARLLPGDVIVIPPAGPRVALLGALDNPAIYELAGPQETMAQLLSYSGGLPALTTPHKVLVERIDPAQTKAQRSVEERALNAQGLQSTVRDGDVITLFKISPEFANAVTLRGNVAAPLRYAYRPGMRVSDLIPEREALIQGDYYVRKNLMVQHESGTNVSGERVVSEIKNLLEEINWDYAAIERLDPKDVRTRLVTFNLGKAVLDKDPAYNLALQPGDVVTIFGVNDLPVPMEKRTQFVRLGGEVKVPGIYQIQPGDTLPQLVQRAGGLASNAFLYGTVFTRESTRAQQQTNLNQAIRRLEAEINSQTAAALQNQQDSEKGGVLQAQLAGQRMLLSRLQGLKASGRIALEMDPQNPVLPPIALEDGDQITIPHQPSFVGVFGAVMAETSFLHRPDHTVRDYLDRAGPTRDADEDSALVIRADGTVESNQAHRSWLSMGGAFMGKRLQPGDTVFVPETLDRRTAYTRFIQGAKDWTAILYQFGLGAAALKIIRD